MTFKKTEILTENPVFSLRKTTIDYENGKQTIEFWLYDNLAGYNLAMRAKSEIEAFTSALQYWHERTKELEASKKALEHKVNTFLSMFHSEYNTEGNYPQEDVDYASSYR